jgi:long-chain acyl-CoA synthetase
MTADEVDRATDALAAAMHQKGTGRGDRVGIYLQNIPQYALMLLALWKLGAVGVLLNPMYKRRELRDLIDIAGVTGFLCDEASVAESAETLMGGTVRWIISTSPMDFQTRDDSRVFGGMKRMAPSKDGDMVDLIRQFDGQRPKEIALSGDDIALLTYTSGTTGPPKAAMNTHRNVLNVATIFGQWVRLTPGDVVLAIAPMFHITGAVVNGVISLISDTTLVFPGRFNPEIVLESFEEHKVSYTAGSITAFNAVSELPQARASHFSSVKHLFTGGAPVPPATVARFRERFGVYIHNAYGMTETTSAAIAVPPGAEAPVDPASGMLSIGVPLPNVTARVVDADGEPVESGSQGELELSGPQVVPGYWQNPEATEHAMAGGRLLTGDVAIMDERGYIYLVDRLKDQINVSGYKVWPREVEDVLYEHPSVHEVAVVGEPDPYRGETVVAFVSLKSGMQAEPEELIGFAKERLAAYKYPRFLHIVENLPKTQTGKIRRAEVRDANTAKGNA